MTDTEQEYQSYNSLFYISRGPQGASLYISDYIDKPSLYYPVSEYRGGQGGYSLADDYSHA
jgi:hypothetical protein